MVGPDLLEMVVVNMTSNDELFKLSKLLSTDINEIPMYADVDINEELAITRI